VRRGLLVLGLALTVAAAIPLALAAQRGGGGYFGFGRRTYASNNLRYDGRFVFARIAYAGYSSWAYDYPEMEQNFTTILRELTSLNPHLEGSNIHTLDDPELLKFPVAYLTEPGYWYPTDAEVAGLRTYLDKGGFLIVDDFFDPYNHFGREWSTFEAGIRRVLPDARIDTLDLSHPVFNSFFALKSLDVPYPGGWGERGLMGEFYGIHENNDPTRRLMVVINYNMDIGDYMEWSATGAYAMAPTNEAYKFGINYVVYGLTH
jgi:hypothetical protein